MEYERFNEEIGMEMYLYDPMDCTKTLKLQFRVGGLGLPERRTRCWYTSSREEEEDVAQMSPCSKPKEKRAHIVGKRQMYKKERHVLEVRKMDVCDIYGDISYTRY